MLLNLLDVFFMCIYIYMMSVFMHKPDKLHWSAELVL